MPKESRSADQARLADEVQSGVGPQANTELGEELDASDDRPISGLWEEVRDFYPPGVKSTVDRIVGRGALSVNDLIFLELAELMMIGEKLAANDEKPLGDRVFSQLTSSALQSRKQLGRLVVARGPLGSPMDVPAAVPEGMTLEDLDQAAESSDIGDEVLGLPDDSQLPERYQ